jgi:hypothetical protein
MLVAAIQASLIEAGEGPEHSGAAGVSAAHQPPAKIDGGKGPADAPAKASKDAGSAPCEDLPAVSAENSEFVQQARPHMPPLHSPSKCPLIGSRHVHCLSVLYFVSPFVLDSKNSRESFLYFPLFSGLLATDNQEVSHI